MENKDKAIELFQYIKELYAIKSLNLIKFLCRQG